MSIDELPFGPRMAAWTLCRDAGLPPSDFDTLKCLVETTDADDWRPGRSPVAVYDPGALREAVRRVGAIELIHLEGIDPGDGGLRESVGRLGRAGILRRAGSGRIDLSPIKEAMG